MFRLDKVLLQRTKLTKYGTRGVLFYDNERIAHTLENPWLNNQRQISCIPVGEYRVRSYSSEKYPDHWILENVESRSYILIHEGNTVKDTLGCILVGDTISQHNNKPAIRNSKRTLNNLKNILPNSFILKIEEQDSKIKTN